MKKSNLLIAIIILLLGVFVTGPWLAGNRIEKRLDDVLTSINKNGVIVFEKTSFDKGLFSSTTKLKMKLDLAALGPAASSMKELPDSEVIMTGNITHGPVLFNSGMSLAMGHITFSSEMDDKTRAEMKEFFGNDNPMSLSMLMGWGDTLLLTGNVIEFQSPDGTVDSKEVNLTVALDDVAGELDTQLDWDGMSAKIPSNNDNIEIVVGKITASSEQTRALPEIWVGSGNLEMEMLKISKKDLNVVANKLIASSDTQFNDDKSFLSGEVELALQDLNVNDVSYAKDFKYKVTVEHLHADSLQRLSKAIGEAKSSGASAEEMQMAMTMQLMGILPAMVQKGLTLRIDTLEAQVMDEAVKASIEVKVAEGTDVSRGMAAIAGVSATADISVSRALLAKFPQLAAPSMIDGLIRQGLIKDGAGVLTTHAEFKEGKLEVNGQIVPLPF